MAHDPFIEKIEGRMRIAADEALQAEYRAEIACYCARTGRFIDAEAICKDLRADFGDGRYPRVSVLIMCIEGLIQFFRDVSLASLDRLARASLLSRSLGMNDVAAFSSAWVAHVNFNFDRYDAMVQALDQCFEKLESSNVEARGRAAVVLSDAFLLSGNAAVSRRWFNVAREAAVDTGDHTLVAALTYNRAALNAHLTQLSILAGEASPKSMEMVSTEMGSAFGFQRLVNLQSLEQLLHLSMVGINIFQGNYGAAHKRAEEVKAIFGDALTDGQRALLSAQADLCVVKLGVKSGDNSIIELGIDIDGLKLSDSGDKALMANCYSRIAEEMGLLDIRDKYDEEVRRFLSDFQYTQKLISGKIAHFADHLDSNPSLVQ